MNCYEQRLESARTKIAEADCIVIGGGAGLSDAAGLRFSGPLFEQHFAEYIERYGFTDLYTSSFHSFDTTEERWAYWAKHIHFARYEMPATRLYQDLLRLVQNRQHFVITTNVDHQFVKAGFANDKVFVVQGNYGLFQCAQRCHDTLYDNEAQVMEMVAQAKNCRIPSDLVPKCPKCGHELDVHVHKDQFFVMGEQWHRDERNYAAFLKQHEGQRIVYLELGVGFNTPGIIRIPFEQFTHENPYATLIRANRDYPGGPKENIARTIAFAEDMGTVVQGLLSTRSTAAVS